MGLLRSLYNKREMERAKRVLGALLPGELLITTNIANWLSPFGVYVEGLFVLTSNRLAFRSTKGPELGFAIPLTDVARLQQAPAPFLYQIGMEIQTVEGDELSATTSSDFAAILAQALIVVDSGQPIEDPGTLIREALSP